MQRKQNIGVENGYEGMVEKFERMISNQGK